MNFAIQAARYAESMMRKEPPLLRDLRETTLRELRHDDMLSGPVTGAFLNMLVRLSGSKTVLEIGTFTGYATLWMAMALPPAGQVFTCESNDKYAGIARRFFERYKKEQEEKPYENRDASGINNSGAISYESSRHPGQPAGIRLIMGPALESRLPQRVDFVFLDADKEHYPEYYEMIKPLLAPGGLMVVDNAFWGGRVWDGIPNMEAGSSLEPDRPSDRKTAAIDRLNRMIADDPDVENVVLTVRDGLHLVRKVR